MKTFICTRYYKVEAKTLKEAKRTLRRDTPAYGKDRQIDFSYIYSGGLFFEDEKWSIKK